MRRSIYMTCGLKRGNYCESSEVEAVMWWLRPTTVTEVRGLVEKDVGVCTSLHCV